MEVIVSTQERQEMVDVTDKVNSVVRDSGVKNGVCHVFALHSTASIIVNENWDPNIIDDFFKAVNQAVPQRNDYKHDEVDGNAQSHILAALTSPGETIPVRDGKLKLGKWQSVMLAEFDGPRSERKVEVTVLES